ncbi:response regulator [Cohnella faecalis]|uniref:Response regulator n=1 Tax=Cohnella faecalis TaxID=2315694 RepID=A0A398CHH9_9BACL|nr:response regulator [Cohnella faecalis]RIE00378.1 response regulator [Cohnella faecalis]
MRQVMIVDDERWIRRGLIQSIPWDELGLELAGEAEDGKDAYDMALEKKPDLMFLDMRMPGLDGKQLLALLRRDLPELLTIVVSGYSDFEYTKEAILHNAFDYLLKPVKKEELASVLEKALVRLNEQESLKRKTAVDNRKNGLWSALFQRERSNDAEREAADDGAAERWKPGEEAVVMVAQPDRFCDRYETQLLTDELQSKLMRDKAFYMGGAWDFALTAAPGDAGEIVLSIRSGQPELREHRSLVADVQALLKQSGNSSYSIGISDPVGHVSELPQAYKQAKTSLSAKKLGIACAILYPKRETASGAGQYPRELETKLLLTLQMGSEEAAKSEFGRFYAAVAEDGMTVDDLQRSASLLVHAIEKQLHASQASLEEISGTGPLGYAEIIKARNDAASIRTLFECRIIPAASAYYGATVANQGEKIVREIQKLIEIHYAQPLSLHQIAESRFVNPDYLSRLFKKTTGRNFVDYLADFRIAKSIEFLKDSKHKNYEIAKKVGYEDYRYFSQIFKKKTGMTIGEFRSSRPPTEN